MSLRDEDELARVFRECDQRSPLFNWLDMHYERIARLMGRKRIRWGPLIEHLGAQGIRDGRGNIPSGYRMSATWRNVCKVREREGRADRPGRAGVERPPDGQGATVPASRPAAPGDAGRTQNRVPAAGAVAPEAVAGPPARWGSGGAEVAGYGERRRSPPPNLAVLAGSGKDRTDEEVEAVFDETRGEADYADRGKDTVFNRGKWRAGAGSAGGG